MVGEILATELTGMAERVVRESESLLDNPEAGSIRQKLNELDLTKDEADGCTPSIVLVFWNRQRIEGRGIGQSVSFAREAAVACKVTNRPGTIHPG